MPDYSLCVTEKYECPHAKNCKRHISNHPKPVNLRQSMTDFGSISGTKDCAYYKPITDRDHDDTNEAR